MSYRPQPFSILPPVVKNIIIINVIFFFATFTLKNIKGIDLSNILGMHMPIATEFKPYQLFTYMFMHGDIGHIFFNLLAIWMFGSTLENFWGPKKFIIYYLVTGLGAALIHYCVVYYQLLPTLNAINELMQKPSNEAVQAFFSSPDFKMQSIEMQNHLQAFLSDYHQYQTNTALYSEIGSTHKIIDYLQLYKEDLLNAPTILGASGALYGILLAYGYMFPDNMVFIYFFPIKAKYLVMLYIGMELYTGIKANMNDNVAHFAHLGGMLVGFILLKVWREKSNTNNSYF